MLEGKADGTVASVLLACDRILWRRGGSLHLGLSGSGEMALSILRLGHAGASKAWFSGGKVSFRDAAASGWGARLTGDSVAAVEEALAEWADLSDAALSLLRPLLYRQAGLPLSQAEALERASFGLVFESGDPAEGARAFLEKRKPCFHSKV
jgi:enoyl-CoA hydratase/carnithine racemase